jgi:hypothetical protein
MYRFRAGDGASRARTERCTVVFGDYENPGHNGSSPRCSSSAISAATDSTRLPAWRGGCEAVASIDY